MGHENTSDERFAAIARSLQAEKGPLHTLQRGVEVAVQLLEGCDLACVSLVHHGKRIDTPAFTCEAARRGDELQYALQEGPCLDAIWHQETVVSQDLGHEPRWPTWGPRAATELGIRSMLCFQLYTRQDSLGALNLYSRRIRAFDEDAITVGFALAAHIAVALAGVQELENANLALVNRTVIGQAEGILMERFKLTPLQAFDALRRVSNETNLKLHVVAAQLVDSGQFPRLDHPAPTA